MFGSGDVVKILLVEFAGAEERRTRNIDRDKAQFERSKVDKKLLFEVADEFSFLQQIKWSDVVYFGGGTTTRLLSVLKKFDRLQDSLDGKVVAGESAGSNMMATYCFSKSGGVMEGLGWLKIKMYPHYEGVVPSEFEDVGKSLPAVLLRNYEYKVFQ